MSTTAAVALGVMTPVAAWLLIYTAVLYAIRQARKDETEANGDE